MEKTNELPAPLPVEQIATLARNAAARAELIDVSSALPSDATVDKAQLLFTCDGKGEIKIDWPCVDQFRGRPMRILGTALMATLEAMIALTNRHKAASSAAFLNPNAHLPTLAAVIDYHATDGGGARTAKGDDPQARFCSHRLLYTFPFSYRWKTWTGQNGNQMTPDGFARFLEKNIADIATPSAEEKSLYESMLGAKMATEAEMRDLARQIEINNESTLKSKERTADGGLKITFEQALKNGSGGDMTVPGLFMISLPIFYKSQPVRVLVRLYFAADKGGEIGWFYELFRIEDLVESAVCAQAQRFAEATGLPVFEGAPEA